MATGNEIRKVTLEIWDNDWCGADHGPTFEIESQYVDSTTRRVTRSFDPIFKGDTLQWDNVNGKLGPVSGLRVSGNRLWFKLFGGSGDDFCPKRFRVVTYDGTLYQSSEMNDWVDNSKGYQIRTAYQCNNRQYGWRWNICPDPCSGHDYAC